METAVMPQHARWSHPLFLCHSPESNDISLSIMLSIITRAKASLLNAICWVWAWKRVFGLISVLILKKKKRKLQVWGIRKLPAGINPRHQLVSYKNSRASRWKSRDGRVWTRVNLYHCMFTVSTKGKGKGIPNTYFLDFSTFTYTKAGLLTKGISDKVWNSNRVRLPEKNPRFLQQECLFFILKSRCGLWFGSF